MPLTRDVPWVLVACKLTVDEPVDTPLDPCVLDTDTPLTPAVPLDSWALEAETPFPCASDADAVPLEP